MIPISVGHCALWSVIAIIGGAIATAICLIISFIWVHDAYGEHEKRKSKTFAFISVPLSAAVLVTGIAYFMMHHGRLKTDDPAQQQYSHGWHLTFYDATDADIINAVNEKTGSKVTGTLVPNADQSINWGSTSNGSNRADKVTLSLADGRTCEVYLLGEKTNQGQPYDLYCNGKQIPTR